MNVCVFFFFFKVVYSHKIDLQAGQAGKTKGKRWLKLLQLLCTYIDLTETQKPHESSWGSLL